MNSNYRSDFKKVFLDFVSEIPEGGKISYANLSKFLKENSIPVSVEAAKNLVRELETVIGKTQKKRLKVLRGFGYVVLTPKEQSDTALHEGGRRIKKTLRKTAKRLNSVDVDKLETIHRDELYSRVRAIDSLLNIADNSLIKPKLRRQHLEVLDITASNLKAISLIEENRK